MVEQKEHPLKTIDRLDGQVDEILEMYDLGEKLHSYEDLHGPRAINENERRQNMVSFLSTKGQSVGILQGCSLWGIAALYIFSRRGAANPLDMSRIRQCMWTSTSVFMVGSSLGCMIQMTKEKQRL